MRIRAVLLMAATGGFALAFAASGSSTPPQTTGYAWAHVGCAPVTTPYAQPPAWIPTAPPMNASVVPGSSYQWMQPGCAPVTTPDAQPPTWVPTASPLNASTVPGSRYEWMQPGRAPVTTPYAQPPET